MATTQWTPTHDEYAFAGFNGTSAAAAITAGTVALMLHVRPTMTWQDISDYLAQTAEKIGPYAYYLGRTAEVGFGRINAYQAALLTLASTSKSMQGTGTAGNNQRKLLRESSGKLHRVFESDKEIFYQNTTDNGTTWISRRISDGKNASSYPSMSQRGSYVYVVWQKENESNWDIAYNYSTNGGDRWIANPALENLTISTDFNCPSSGPTPVIQVSNPNGSFSLLVVYRQSSGLSSSRTTVQTPLSTDWSSPVAISGTNHNSRNPSLVYKNNSYAYHKAVWDEPVGGNGKLYFENFYPGSPDSWTGLVWVNAGSYGLVSAEKNPTVAINQNNDLHIAWQGTYNGKGSIITCKNLTTVYTVLANDNSSVLYSSPSITGNVNNRASLVWQDNSGNIWKATYANGAWGGGTTVGGYGSNPSVSIMNPAGGDAKVVWTEGTESPYIIHLDGSTLTKPAAGAAIAQNLSIVGPTEVRRRVIVRDTVYNAFATMELSRLRLVRNDATEQVVEFKPVDDGRAYSIAEAMETLETEPFAVSLGVQQLALKRSIRTLNIAQLGNQANVRLEVIDASTGSFLAAFGSLDLIGNNGSLTVDDTVSFMPAISSGRLVKVRAKFENLSITQRRKVVAILNIQIHRSEEQSITRPVDPQTPNVFTLDQTFPNPFNPVTHVGFRVPNGGFVTLKVFDVLGREVATLVNDYREAGRHTVRWNAAEHAGGVYFCRLTAGDRTAVMKMILSK